MATLQGEHASFQIDVLARHIPEGMNSWENNWLAAEFALLATDEEARFCTQRLTVHDIYDLYFHLGIVLQGLSRSGIFVPLLQRQLKFKLTPEGIRYKASLEMVGGLDIEFVTTPEAVACFARGLHEILDSYPLRADEVPSVAPVIEFYSTRRQPERLKLSHGLWGLVRSLFKVANPLGAGRGDAIRFTFTLSKPTAQIDQTAIENFFVARNYQVQWYGDVLRAVRGGSYYWQNFDGKQLPTQVQFLPADTHTVVTYDVWTAGVRQSSRKMFTWVGEAAMLEVFLAGCKGLDVVRERLSIMDSNLRRASIKDLRRLAIILAALSAVVLLAP
ncbi:MAG: hypothetical protein FD169_1113 [Bacillota bacterium]|nr:MAG: hypothetical protein FD169_1113 [Bacillota bacterium]MBS3949725.1 hypothetical protein [Peptococcaceae bacterium]